MHPSPTHSLWWPMHMDILIATSQQVANTNKYDNNWKSNNNLTINSQDMKKS